MTNKYTTISFAQRDNSALLISRWECIREKAQRFFIIVPYTKLNGVFRKGLGNKDTDLGLRKNTALQHQASFRSWRKCLPVGFINGTKIALGIAECFKLPLQAIHDVCLLHRKHNTSSAYWERWNQLHSQLSWKFYGVMKAVEKALEETPRSSSMVENFNSRLRNYFFLRRSLGDGYLSLLQFFLNYRCFIRSMKPERVGKSPKQLLTGEAHPHWLELLGFERFQRA